MKKYVVYYTHGITKVVYAPSARKAAILGCAFIPSFRHIYLAFVHGTSVRKCKRMLGGYSGMFCSTVVRLA